VGLGITPSAWNASSKAFQIGASGNVFLENYNGVTYILGYNAYRSVASGYLYTTTGYSASLFGSGSTGGFQWNIAPSGTAGNAITFTQAMTLDASGNLGIGTSSPARRLDVRQAYTADTIVAQIGNTNNGNGATPVATIFDFTEANGTSVSRISSIYTQSTGKTDLAFGTYNGGLAEKMRLDSSGNLLVGQTVAGGANSTSFGISPSNGYITYNHISGTGGGAAYCAFDYNASLIGSITQNGTTGVLYNLTSDYRLKNDQQALTGAKDFIMALKPKKWQWWDGSGEGVGFVAHEFMEVAKYSGNGEKDAMDDDGKPIYQSIQPSSSEVMANLVAFIQEQQALITILTARITALESA
jgi:hypothetical protein